MSYALIGNKHWGSVILKELSSFYDTSKVIQVNTSSAVTIDDVAKDNNISHVFIATPVPTHYEITKKMLLGGKNVFCEKIFTETLFQTEELVTLAREQNLTLTIDYLNSVSDKLLKIRSVLDDKKHHQIHIRSLQCGRTRRESILTMSGSHIFSVLHALNVKDLQLLYYNELPDSKKVPIWSRIMYKSSVGDIMITLSAIRDAFEFEDRDFIVSLDEYRQHKFKTVRDIVIDGAPYQYESEGGVRKMIEKFLNKESNGELSLFVARSIDQLKL